MSAEDARRRLLWHGVLMFLLGLLGGALVPLFPNPRMALSAHVDALMSGTFLAVVGLAWSDIRTGRRSGVAIFWLLLYGMYAVWAALVAAAILRTSQMTPIAGSGLSAPAWRELVVNLPLGSGSVTLVVACALLLRAFGGRAR